MDLCGGTTAERATDGKGSSEGNNEKSEYYLLGAHPIGQYEK